MGDLWSNMSIIDLFQLMLPIGKLMSIMSHYKVKKWTFSISHLERENSLLYFLENYIKPLQSTIYKEKWLDYKYKLLGKGQSKTKCPLLPAQPGNLWQEHSWSGACSTRCLQDSTNCCWQVAPWHRGVRCEGLQMLPHLFCWNQTLEGFKKKNVCWQCLLSVASENE